MNIINGVLFTGGGVNLDINTPLPHRKHKENYNIFTKNAKFIIDMAKQFNQNGSYFPVFGIC